ncbi:hypothetical protein [Heyndrickxia acidiproducens]|uniref:hypothetical protein n=1 Tax=Heyndrickxia acidiproducens TaxID=1121084 RepID=UPI0003776B28|nr:hypothetical protein [Heyndrickxia acidiproducens]
MNRKVVLGISLVYIGWMAVLAVMQNAAGESWKSAVAVGGIVSGAVPLALVLFTKLRFNLPLVISYFIFLFASQYLGSIRGWYGFGWWDTFLHFISGAILGFTAVALYERMVHRKAGQAISPWFVFLFVLGIANLGGMLWEIYEFTCDRFFGFALQGGGNRDTMIDLIADVLGGLVIACWSGIRTKMKQ